MNPAEEIVNAWLNEKGFFTITNIQLFGRQEIDILAINPLTNEKLHVECHVSVKPLGRLRAKGKLKEQEKPFEARIKEIYEKKFVGKSGTKAAKVKELLGTQNYKKIQVYGVLPAEESADKVKKEFAKYGVEVILFEGVISELRDIIAKRGRKCSETIRSYVQLCDVFLKRK